MKTKSAKQDKLWVFEWPTNTNIMRNGSKNNKVTKNKHAPAHQDCKKQHNCLRRRTYAKLIKASLLQSPREIKKLPQARCHHLQKEIVSAAVKGTPFSDQKHKQSNQLPKWHRLRSGTNKSFRRSTTWQKTPSEVELLDFALFGFLANFLAYLLRELTRSQSRSQAGAEYAQNNILLVAEFLTTS